MKAIIYTGVVLMAAATVYGFADLSRNAPKASYELKSETATEVSKEEKVLPATTVIEEKKVSSPAKRKTVKREPTKEVTAEKDLLPISSEVPLPLVVEGVSATEPTALKENSSGKKIEAAKKKKRVKTKMFSRAALAEEYLEETPKKGNRQ